MPHVVGAIYTNKELNEETGCSIMGGIRVAHTTNSIVLVHVPNSVYVDRPSPQNPTIFLYTGQGLDGNQKMEKSNLALRNSEANGVTIHLYVKEVPNQYCYQGVYRLAEEVFTEEQYDQKGNLRTVFMFPITAI